MKTTNIIKLTLWTAALLLVVGCSSTKGLGRHSGRAQSEEVTPRGKYSDQVQRGKKAKSDDTAGVQEGTDTATVAPLDKGEIGNRQMTLTGNLKMKRDDVIRLQLMAFGFVEAGRLEFTKDYVLIVDRINKQYLKVPYDHLEFLRSTNINFNTLQALFWNEVYLPNGNDESALSVEQGIDNDVVLSYEYSKLSYRWLTEQETGRIKMANILYNDYYRGNSQLNWDYSDFKANERKFLPTKHVVTFTTSDKQVKLDMKLSYIGKDEDWETRTELSGKYRQVPVDDILRRFMAL